MRIKRAILTLLILLLMTNLSNAQWKEIPWTSSNPPVFFKEIKFISEDIGLAKDLYNSIYITKDGCANWDSIFNRYFLSDFEFVDSNIFLVGTYNGLFRTVDAGQSWLALDTGKMYMEIEVINDSVIYTSVLNDSLYYSTDTGNTWAAFPTQPQFGNFPYIMEFLSEDIGYFTGNMFSSRTLDAGQSWTSIPLIAHKTSFPAIDKGFKMVNNVNSSDTFNFYSTIDTCQSWQLLSSIPSCCGFYDFQFVSDSVGYVVGSGELRKSYDGGYTWYSQFPDSSNWVGGLHSVSFVNENIGYAAGWNGYLLKYDPTDDSLYNFIKIIHIDSMPSGSDNFEACDTSYIQLYLNGPALDTFLVVFDSIGGTAVAGLDYSPLPDTVVFLPGVSFMEIPIYPFNDSLNEGAETVIIYEKSQLADSMYFVINDYDPIYQISFPNDTAACIGDTLFLPFQYGGGAQNLSFEWRSIAGNAVYNHSLPFTIVTDSSLYTLKVWDFPQCSSHTDTLKVSTHYPINPGFIASANSGIVNDPLIFTDTTNATDYWNMFWSAESYVFWNTPVISYTFTNPGMNTVSLTYQNACGVSARYKSIYMSNIGIEDAAEEVKVQLIYLSEGNYQVVLESEVSQFELYSLSGQLLTSEITSASVESEILNINLSGLSRGIYLLEVVDVDGGRFSVRLVN